MMEYQKIINSIDNTIVDMVAKSHDGRVTKVSKDLQQNNSQTLTNISGRKTKIVDNLIFNKIV